MKNQSARTPVMSGSDSVFLVAQLTEATNSDLPPHESLQAIAKELPEGKPKIVLSAIAERLGAGQAMTEVLADPSLRLANDVRGLLVAAFRSGDPRSVLADVRDFLLESTQRRIRYWQTMAYPCVLFALSIAFLMFTVLFLVPNTTAPLVEDFGFGVELPAATRFLLWTADTGVWIVLGCVVLVVFSALVANAVYGRRWLHRLRRVVPFVGPAIRYDAQTRLLGVLAMLLRHEVPLGEALKLTAETSADQSFNYSYKTAASRVDKGQTLSEAVVDTDCFPIQAMRLIEWGESRSQLTPSLRTASDLCSQYARLYSHWLRVAVPAATFLIVVWIANLMMASTFVPLINLINSLSG